MHLVGEATATGRPDHGEPIFIELDVSAEWEPPSGENPRVRPTWWIGFLLAPLLVFGLVTGGDRKTSLDPVFELAAGTQQRALIGDILYVTTGSPGELRAYDVPSGRMLWRRAATDDDIEWQRFGETIAIARAGADGVEPSVEVVDGPTGLTLWRRDGVAVVGGGEGQIVLRRFVLAGPTDSRDRDSVLIGVDRRTGVPSWSEALARGVAAFVVQTSDGEPGDAGAHVVISESDGSVRTLAVGTGTTNPPGGAEAWQPRRRDRTPSTMPAIPCLVYLSGAQAGSQDSRTVCLPDDIRGVMLDVTSGKRDGALDGLSAPGRAIEIDDGTITVTDTRTGNVIRVLRGWSGVGVLNGDRIVLARTAAGSEAAAGSDSGERGSEKGVTGERASLAGAGGEVEGAGSSVSGKASRRSQIERSLLATMDPSSGRLTVLGLLPSDMGNPACVGAGSYLLCSGGSRLGVWRLERSALA